MPQQQGQPQQVPVKSTPQTKYIGSFADLADLEKAVNEFLETTSDTKRLVSTSMIINSKTGEYLAVLNYSNVRPFTVEELIDKKSQEEAFIAPIKKFQEETAGSKI